MSDMPAGFDAQRSHTSPVHDPAALKKAAKDALDAYLDSISDARRQQEHRRFFEALARVQKDYIHFPVPAAEDYINDFDEWIDSCNVHKRYGFGHYVFDKYNNLEIGTNYVRLKKGAQLTPEQARSLAMAIYLNPKAARNGVTATGTEDERRMLESALDEINALNPGAHQVKILNRLTPEPMITPQPTNPPPPDGDTRPCPANASMDREIPVNPFQDVSGQSTDKSTAKKPPSLEEVLENLLQQNPEAARNLWQIVRADYERDKGLKQPQPDEGIKNKIEREEAHRKALAAFDDSIKGDVKNYWDVNTHMHAKYIEATQTTEATREEVMAKIHADPVMATAIYQFIAEHYNNHYSKEAPPAAVLELWEKASPGTIEGILNAARGRVDDAKARIEAAVKQAAETKPEAPAKANGANGHANGHDTNGHANGAAEKGDVYISDALLHQAFNHVVTTRNATQNDLRHALGIGERRARAILQKLESEGVVTAKPSDPFKPRRVLFQFNLKTEAGRTAAETAAMSVRGAHKKGDSELKPVIH